MIGNSLPMAISYDCLDYGYGQELVLQQISSRLPGKALTALLGINGAGKSTLLKLLCRLLKPRRGTVLLNNEDLSGIRLDCLARQTAYVSQQHVLARMTVFEYLLLGRTPHRHQTSRSEDETIVLQVLKDMELSDFADRQLTALSGGERQQTVIARALVQQPRLLLLDEPTNNLDLKHQLAVMTTIRRRIRQDGMTVLFSIHDINLALRFADHFLLLDRGNILYDGQLEGLTAELLSKAYGVPLVSHELAGRQLVLPR